MQSASKMRAAVETAHHLPPPEGMKRKRILITLRRHQGCLPALHKTLLPKRFMPQDAAFIHPLGEKCGLSAPGARKSPEVIRATSRCERQQTSYRPWFVNGIIPNVLSKRTRPRRGVCQAAGASSHKAILCTSEQNLRKSAQFANSSFRRFDFSMVRRLPRAYAVRVASASARCSGSWARISSIAVCGMPSDSINAGLICSFCAVR